MGKIFSGISNVTFEIQHWNLGPYFEIYVFYTEVKF